MDLSGVIFVMLAVAWAVYLIPKTLKQHDEVARTRSINRFSGATRVLARREAVSSRDARLVVPSAATGADRTVHSSESVPGVDAAGASALSVSLEPASSRGRVEARRTAARAAARRRRRILTGLLLVDAVVGVLGYLGVVPVWSVAVPVALTMVYLVLCRTQVRREGARDAAVLTSRSAEHASEPAGRADELVEKVLVLDQDVQALLAEADEDTVGIPVADLQAALIASPDDESGADASTVVSADSPRLWDPLPVTLPTYVTKAKARRTVRTIDLGEPGTWTSGRTAEDAEVVARSAESSGVPTGSTATGQESQSSASEAAGRRVVGG